MYCFHCGDVIKSFDVVMIVRPHKMEWSQELGEPLKISLETMVSEDRILSFHSECYVIVAGEKYVP